MARTNAAKREYPKKRRRRNISPEVLAQIEILSAGGSSAVAIKGALERDPDLEGLRIPEERTVQEIVKASQVSDDSGTWSPVTGDLDSDSSRLVAETAAAIALASGGKAPPLTAEQAMLVGRIRSLVPDLHPLAAYRVARWYQIRLEADRPTHDLDLFLSAQPWRSPTLGDQYRAAIQGGWGASMSARGWSAPHYSTAPAEGGVQVTVVQSFELEATSDN